MGRFSTDRERDGLTLDVSDVDSLPPLEISRSARKRHQQDQQTLIDHLLDLTPRELQPFALSEDLAKAVAAGQKLKAQARARQVKYIVQLLDDEEYVRLVETLRKSHHAPRNSSRRQG